MKTIAVIGAGTMGSGIGQKAAQEGFEVILCDVSASALERGMETIKKFLEEAVQRKIFSVEKATEIQRRIHPTVNLQDVEPAELVIEAVFEDLQVKRELFEKLEKICQPSTLLASNTSSLLVTELAKSVQRPDRFGGLHYFYHPAKNRLVEVIPGAHTSSDTVKGMVQFNKMLGKVTIVCGDRPGFVVNRFFVPWLNEAVRLLEEGVSDIPTIETVAKEAFLIGMGPFELMNVTGIPIAAHALTAMASEMGSFYSPASLLTAQVDKKQPWDLSGTSQTGASAETVKRRLLGVVFGLACQIVEEKVCVCEDVDRGAKIGLRWAEGPFEMMNKGGIDASASLVLEISKKYPAFVIPPLLSRQVTQASLWNLSTVDFRVEGGIATITLNRPEALNAINETLMKDLDRAISRANADTSVKVIVLEGAGKAFGAGADVSVFVKAIEAQKVPDLVSFTTFGHEVLKKIDDSPKLVIAKLHGPAIGGGAEIALTADILVASDKAVIGFPETGLGIYPGLGGTQRLPRRVSKELGLYLILTGDMLDGQRAWEMGLVDEVVSMEELDVAVDRIAQGGAPKKALSLPGWAREMKEIFSDSHLESLLTKQPISNGFKPETVDAVTKKISRKAPLAVHIAQRLIKDGMAQSLAQGLQMELKELSTIFGSQDAHEGLSSLLQKRRPTFTGC